MDQASPRPVVQGAGGRSWDGYFINLDGAIERRRRMEAQFHQFGLSDRYERFPAIDGRALNRGGKCTAGECGIFQSHLEVIERIAAGSRPGHILEDDVLLSDLTGPTIDSLVERSIVDQFDITFLEIYVSLNPAAVRHFHHTYNEAILNGPIASPDQLTIIDIGTRYSYGATSYVISPQAARKLATVLRREWERGPNLAVDVVYQAAATRGLKLGCVFPFVTTIDLETAWDSNAGRRSTPDEATLQRVIRYGFFVRRDIPGYARPMLDRILARLPAMDESPLGEIYSAALRYYMLAPPKPDA